MKRRSEKRAARSEHPEPRGDAGKVFFLVGDCGRRARLLERLCYVLGQTHETVEAWMQRHAVPGAAARLRILDAAFDTQLEQALNACVPMRPRANETRRAAGSSLVVCPKPQTTGEADRGNRDRKGGRR